MSFRARTILDRTGITSSGEPPVPSQSSSITGGAIDRALDLPLVPATYRESVVDENMLSARSVAPSMPGVDGDPDRLLGPVAHRESANDESRFQLAVAPSYRAVEVTSSSRYSSSDDVAVT